jgi:hypothetical protein
VGIDVAEILLLELHHQLLQCWFVLGEALDLEVVLLHFVEGGDRAKRGVLVAVRELSADVQIQEDVHTLVGQALDPVVQRRDPLGVELAGVALGLVDHRGADPAGRVVVVDPNQVVAQAGQALGLGLDLLLGAEDGVGRQVAAPEAGRCAVLEFESLAPAHQEAVLARRLVIEGAQVYR